MTKRQQDQLLRISAMEAVLQRAKPVLEDLERDLDRLEQLAPGLCAQSAGGTAAGRPLGG